MDLLSFPVIKMVTFLVDLVILFIQDKNKSTNDRMECDKLSQWMALIKTGLNICSLLKEESCRWAGSHIDSSADQSCFAEADRTVIDAQILHAAHKGIPGGNVVCGEVI